MENTAVDQRRGTGVTPHRWRMGRRGGRPPGGRPAGASMAWRRQGPRGIVLSLLILALVGAAPFAVMPTPAAADSGATFTPELAPNPCGQQYTVPAGVYLVQVVAIGGSGQAGSGFSDGAFVQHSGGRGGHGAQVTAVVAVQPGETLDVVVAHNGDGGGDAYTGYPTGGYLDQNNKGDTTSIVGYGAGGGSSFIVRDDGSCTFSQSTYLVVAGGGGGGGGAQDGGGGGDGGDAGVNADGSGGNGGNGGGGGCGYGKSGSGATVTSPGSGGRGGCVGGANGDSGSGSDGGNIENADSNGLGDGGAGGGGWYGGGAGGTGVTSGGGGGAGSSGVGPAAGLLSLATTSSGPMVTITPIYSPPNSLLTVAAGSSHSCALTAQGTVACWGDNTYDQSTPPAGTFTSLSAGADFTCGIKTDNSIACWGNDATHQTEAPSGPFHQVSAGRDFACGLRLDSTIACWGDNTYGQSTPPSGLYVAISSGSDFACAIRDDQAAVCWGLDNSGSTNVPDGQQLVAIAASSTVVCGVQLDGTGICWGGYSATRGIYTALPGTFTGLASVSTTPNTMCWFKADQTIQCQGDFNYFGELLPPAGTYTAVSLGGEHGCGAQTGGGVVCWGDNESGEARPQITGGIPPQAAFNTPYTFAFATTYASPTPTFSVTDGALPPGLSLSPNGVLSGTPTQAGTYTVTVSAGNGGPLAPSTLTFSLIVAQATSTVSWAPPGAISAGTALGAAQLDASASLPGTFSYAPPAGSILPVGANQTLSVTFTPTDSTDYSVVTASVPLTVTPRLPSVAAGGDYTCGLTAVGAVTCWGDNTYGQSAPPSGTFTALSAGGTFACGVRTDGTLACWGDNSFGQATPPSGAFTAVSVGNAFACGLRTDGTLACWGNNNAGQAMPPSGTFTALSAGAGYACAVGSDQTLSCWGDAADGRTQAPSGSFISVASDGTEACAVRVDGTMACWGLNPPSPPAGLVTALSGGVGFFCGLHADHTPVCWGGANLFGEESPPSGTYLSISAGLYFACGVRTDQSVVCWGDDRSNQLHLAITSGTPPVALLNAPYTFAFTTSFASPAADFALTGGALPPGLSLSASGVLSGTPTQAGTYTITVSADNHGLTPPATTTVALVVGLPPAIDGATYGETNLDVTLGSPLSQTVAITGVPAPAVTTSGNLPAGVTFDPTTGRLSGTPGHGTAGIPEAEYNLFITAHGNGVGGDAQRLLTVFVHPAPLTVTPDDTSIVYGSPLPTAFTVQYSGFVLGDTASALSGTPKCVAQDSQGRWLQFYQGWPPPGTYTINCNFVGLSSPDDDYSISYQTGTLTITNPAPTTSSLSPAAVQAGGASFPLTISGTNFVPGSTVVLTATDGTSTTLTPSAVASDGTQLTVTVPATLSAQAGTLQVAVVNAAPGGGTSNLQPLFVTTSGAAVASTSSSTGGTASTGGSGPNTPGSITLSGSGGSGTVAVTLYSANPGTTPSFAASGAYFDAYVAPGSTFSSVRIVDCALQGGSQADWYNAATGAWVAASNQSYDATTQCTTITVDASSTPNLTQLGGTPFGIAHMPPVVTVPGAQSVQYGSQVSFTVAASEVEPSDVVTLTASGLPAGLSLGPTSFNQASGKWTATVAGTVTASAGPYTTTIAATNGYTMSTGQSVSIAVTPAPLTITADDQTTPYGQVPAYTWTGTGFVNGDSASTLATAPNSAPTCSASVGGSAESATTAPGIYPGAITCAGAVDPNYAISYQSGQLTIDPLLSLDEQGLPGSVPRQATLDGQTVSLPDANVEVAYGSSYSYSFPALVIDGSSGTVYFTSDQGFTGAITATVSDTAVYQTMDQIIGAAQASGGIDNHGQATVLTNLFDAVQADIAASNTAQALSDVQSFADRVQKEDGQHLTAATAQALLADAQLVYAHLGGTGQV